MTCSMGIITGLFFFGGDNPSLVWAFFAYACGGIGKQRQIKRKEKQERKKQKQKKDVREDMKYSCILFPSKRNWNF